MVKCQSCGGYYGIDLLVPDGLWEDIKPRDKEVGAGLLCPKCILERIVSMMPTYGVLHLSQAPPISATELLAWLEERRVIWLRRYNTADEPSTQHYAAEIVCEELYLALTQVKQMAGLEE